MARRSGTAFFSFLLMAMLTLSVDIAAAASRLPFNVQQAMRQAALPPGVVGIYVQDVAQASPLLAYNADHAMNPASVMKLLTTYAGLELLGPAYTWQTGVYANGVMHGDVLQGDLVMQGHGDPALTLERFWLLLRTLRINGLREIHGDLVLDRSYFAIQLADPNGFDKQPYRAYNVLPDALLVNFKITEIRLAPDAEHGMARLTADPLPTPLALENHVELDTSGACGDWKEKLSVQPVSGATPHYALSGKYAAACGEKVLELSLFDSNHYFQGLFRQFWESLGGKLTGGVREGATPVDARPLLQFNSVSLADTIRGINKFSNNVMARHLFLTLGAQNGAPATVEKSASAVKNWLTTKKLDFPELALENGAGLSRTERISARHLGLLLNAAYQSPVFSELESSLPIVAVDGTMKKRLGERNVAGHAHIKTGSLEGVRAVAGYVFDRKGRRVAIVCLINHPNAAAGKAVEDALLEWIYERK
jgi:D-alanyl-D-alanine carboxypeptidase/D-alanyl-D-alanine-endopeptidase (penicillin-binding protein 4)